MRALKARKHFASHDGVGRLGCTTSRGGFLSRMAKEGRRFLLICVVLPYLTSLLIRTYAWMVLLSDDSPIKKFLLFLGLINKPLPLLFSTAGALIGMVHLMLPAMTRADASRFSTLANTKHAAAKAGNERSRPSFHRSRKNGSWHASEIQEARGCLDGRADSATMPLVECGSFSCRLASFPTRAIGYETPQQLPAICPGAQEAAASQLPLCHLP